MRNGGNRGQRSPARDAARAKTTLLPDSHTTQPNPSRSEPICAKTISMISLQRVRLTLELSGGEAVRLERNVSHGRDTKTEGRLIALALP